MKDYFQTLARYNTWANSRLCNTCADLSPEELRRDRQAFFGSILGTLNHLLLAERLWLARLDGQEMGPVKLNEVPYEEFGAFRAAREAEDRNIQAYVDGLDPETLYTDLRYRSIAGHYQSTPVRYVLTHMFNHATHHRGQVHDMLVQVPIDPPPLDLVYYLRDAA